MTTCDVCCEKFNKIHHKKVECPFCDLKSCRSCSQRYILESFQDPHCMGCKTIWNREFVDSFCTKYFRNTELRRHREKVLFEREKALMPQSQKEVERILEIRRLRRKARKLRATLIELYQRYRLSFPINDRDVEAYPLLGSCRKYFINTMAFKHGSHSLPSSFYKKWSIKTLVTKFSSVFIYSCGFWNISSKIKFDCLGS